jgi:hypothetical protein
MPAISRIRTSTKGLVRSYCVTVYLPLYGTNNVYKKESDCSIPDGGFHSDRFNYDKYRPGARAIKAILAVPGVTVVRQFDYELAVTIAAAYNWSECHDAILAAIKQHLFTGIENVEEVGDAFLEGRQAESFPRQ